MASEGSWRPKGRAKGHGDRRGERRGERRGDRRATEGASEGSCRGDGAGERGRQHVELSRPQPVGEQERQSQLRQGQRVRQPLELRGLELLALAAEGGGAGER